MGLGRRWAEVAVLPRPTRKQAVVLLAVAGASMLLSFLLDRIFGAALPLNPQALRDWLQGLGPAAPIAYIGLIALAIVVTPMPSVPLDIASGMAFGLFWGTVYTLIGAQLGATIAFLLARRFGRPWLQRRLPSQAMEQIDRMTDNLGFQALFLMRLLPVFNFDWVSYAAGLTPMSLRLFTLATFGGMVAPVIAIVSVGDSLTVSPGRAALIFSVLVLATVLPLILWVTLSMKPAGGGPTPAEEDPLV